MGRCRSLAGLPVRPASRVIREAPRRAARRPSRSNRPRHFDPGDDYVDWVGTDFYSDNQDWKSLNGLYNRYPDKPFALPEWGVSSGDDPAYVRQLMTGRWSRPALQDARRHHQELRLGQLLPDPELPGQPWAC